MLHWYPAVGARVNATDPQRTGLSPERFDAFSDGVLAIAITLLVLEIKVPTASQGRLWHELGRLWPSYAAYAVSFLTIGIMWVNHHNLSRRLVAVDHGLVYANLGLLATVSFLPFPTAVLAEYLRDGGSNEQAATALYGITMIAVSLAFWLLWAHLGHHHELVQPGRTGDISRQAAKAAVAIGIYVIATAISVLSAVAALIAFALVAVAFAINRLT
jgi:uncharacterized membrane protein